ncbi:hypothetical protein V6M85_12440 [Sulfolobus tengchongensis]|uniref:Uncharacterized protein n=1 Tax=Sulfolobus tengchongensis TaxID=207809 RepID=A0AAX4L0I6_9CREN
MAKSIGIGTILIIISIILIGGLATIFYLENIDVNISVNPLFWRVYPNGNNINNIIALSVEATNNAPFTQALNITAVMYYYPVGKPPYTIIANGTTLSVNSHSTSRTIIYLYFTSTSLIPEIIKFVIVIHGLYGYSKQLGNVEMIYSPNVSKSFAILSGIGNNQFPAINAVGSFTPTANFNYSFSLIYFQYNYTNGETALLTRFEILPFGNNYLTPGKYNITLKFLNYTHSFPVLINSKNPVTFYLVTPLTNYNLSISIEGPSKYYGVFTITLS